MKALRKTFNSTKAKDVENRSNGTNAKMVPWYSNRNSPDSTKIKLGIATTAKRKHKQWLEKLVHILLGMVEELQTPILSEANGEITLYQILMSLRSKICYDCTIFMAINRHTVSGNIEALCHSRYEEEANKIITNLVTLCNERFGQKTTK